MNLRFRALAPIKTFCGELAEFTSFCGSTLHFALKDGHSSVHVYQEDIRSLDERIVVLGGLQRGEGLETTLVLFKGRFLDTADGPFLFSRPGRYRLTARYEGYGVKVESNALEFEVDEPDAEGRAILDAAIRHPGLLGPWPSSREGAAQLVALLAAHPHHPYLRFARMAGLTRNLSDRHAIGSPEWQEFRRQHEDLDAIAFQRAWQDHVTRDYAFYALSLLEEPDWGPFEDEKLIVIACAPTGAEHADDRKRARRALLDRFPRSDAARRLKAECR